MVETARFLIIAVGTVVVLWGILAAIGVSTSTLQRTVIVLGFVGVAVAIIVEALLKRRAAARSKAPPQP